MTEALLIFAGGGAGAVLRWLLGRAMLGWLGAGFPWGTLACNVIGGAAMGVLAGLLLRLPAEPLRLLLGVGVLGGFTTFSAFSLEVVLMIERGDLALAGGYALLSVVASVAALAIGLAAARALA
jgi:CrcB protein